MIKGGFSVPLEVALVQVQLTSDIQQQHVVNQYHGFIDPGAVCFSSSVLHPCI
jgi:hypothetical protein